jgi:hypothetical protein
MCKIDRITVTTKCFILVLALWGWPHIAISADLVLGGDQEMECYATLSGVIESGDAEQVALALDSLNYRNVGPFCLDSPGGLWAEGLALMELFYELAIPTAIAAGARCESACAIAFLGGSTRSMTVTPFRARFLHVDGHLGFHAPNLQVPPGQYDEATVLAAFQKAMEVVTGLTAWAERLSLPDAFLVRLFGTNFNDMDFIDTVGEAAELSVQLVGHVLPEDLTEAMISEACRQALPFFGGGSARYDSDAGIANVFRIRPNRNRTQRGVAVAVYSIESWRGWYVCVVGYGSPPRPVPSPDWFDLSRFDGARDVLYVLVSDDPIQEWDDPMSFAPDPSLSAVLQAAEPMSEIFPDNHAIRAETVFPADTPIRRMRFPDWIQDPPAPLMRTSGQFAAFASQPTGQVTPAYSSFWDHNGSGMGLVVEGSSRLLYYATPRAALAERGVAPGTLLFEGERNGSRYEGTARIFARPPCGEFTYPVEGPVSDDQRSVTMFGRAPRVNERCEITGFRDDTLVFTLE